MKSNDTNQAVEIQWYPYPETAPDSEWGGEYLVTTKNARTGRREVAIDYYVMDDPNGPYFEDDSEACPVIAWAEIPEAFAGAAPKFVLLASIQDGKTTTVIGDSLDECKEQAVDWFTAPDATNFPIRLRENYTGRLVSTWIPETNAWEDE